MQIVALIEGMMLFTAPGAKPLGSRASLARLLKRTMTKLLISDEVVDQTVDAA